MGSDHSSLSSRCALRHVIQIGFQSSCHQETTPYSTVPSCLFLLFEGICGGVCGAGRVHCLCSCRTGTSTTPSKQVQASSQSAPSLAVTAHGIVGSLFSERTDHGDGPASSILLFAESRTRNSSQHQRTNCHCQ